jgi:hypothetical protein
MTLHRYEPLAAAIAAAALLAGCGGGSSTPRSTRAGGHLTYAQAQQAAVNFAGCMRSHGVPSFPDPTSPGEFKLSMSSGSAVTRSPAFQSAAGACQHLLGGNPPSENAAHGRTQTAALLAFARCLRSHGFPGFPDPTSSGQISHEMIANAGINLHQPAVLQAADACVGVTHGVITKALVARFVAGR